MGNSVSSDERLLRQDILNLETQLNRTIAENENLKELNQKLNVLSANLFRLKEAAYKKQLKESKATNADLQRQLHELQTFKANDKEVSWEFLTDFGWSAYDKTFTEILEKSYKNGNNSYSFTRFNIPYVISFSDMKQKRLDKIKSERNVRRIKHTPSSLSTLHKHSWNLSNTPWILQNNNQGIRIKEIKSSQLDNKLTRELCEFNIASGHYYNNTPDKTDLKTISKIWVIEYLPHHPVLVKYEETRNQFQSQDKPTSK